MESRGANIAPTPPPPLVLSMPCIQYYLASYQYYNVCCLISPIPKKNPNHLQLWCTGSGYGTSLSYHLLTALLEHKRIGVHGHCFAWLSCVCVCVCVCVCSHSLKWLSNAGTFHPKTASMWYAGEINLHALLNCILQWCWHALSSIQLQIHHMHTEHKCAISNILCF